MMKHLIPFPLVGLLLTAAVSANAATHELKLTPANVHWGYYDARVKPVLKIASGDTVRVETMVAGGLERLRLAGATEAEIPDSLKQVENAVTDRGPGAHPLTGPIYVDGAEPGDILEIRIQGFEFLHPYGMTGARIMCTLLNDLETLDRTIGLETMCVGGGQGMAMLVERL